MISNSQLLDAMVTMLEEHTTGLNIYRVPPQSVEPPAVMVTGFDYQPHLLYGDTARKTDIELTVAVSARHSDLFDELLALIDPTIAGSVVSAIELDATLDGQVGSCMVTQVGSLRELAVGEMSLWGATINVEIMG